eukprot:11079212-Alexandrium_andersonii.AAC.1
MCIRDSAWGVLGCPRPAFGPFSFAGPPGAVSLCRAIGCVASSCLGHADVVPTSVVPPGVPWGAGPSCRTGWP